MTTMLRRYYSLIFILFLAISMIYHMPVLAAETDNRCGDNLTWTLENGTLRIQGKGDMYNYTQSQVPWKAQSANITKVEVLPGVTSISAYAFYNYTKLTSANLADTVAEIGERAFYGCTSLSNLTLPYGLAVIPLEGFHGCKALTELKIPNTVTSIGTKAFWGCSGLTTLSIPDSVNGLGQYSFNRCENLETVSIGTGLNGFGNDIFYGCPKLSKVNISPDNPHHSSIDGVVYSKEKEILHFHPPANGTSLTIPDSVCSIDKYAFDENYTGLAGHVSMLKEIYFEGSAPILDKNCFYSITADVYYPEDDASWTDVITSTYGGTITWKPYKPDRAEKISLEDCQITLEYDHIQYGGNTKYPDATVIYNGKTLKEGIHYTVTYEDNKNIGTAKVIFTGKGSYTGSVTKTFVIEKADQTLDLSIPNTTIEVGYTNQITAIATRGSLYVSYTSDHPEIASVDQKGKVTGIAPGKAVITVTSEGNDIYLPISKILTITVIPVAEGPVDINKCEIKMSSGNQSYTGYPMKAVFIIKRGSSTYLVQNRDYTVTCVTIHSLYDFLAFFSTFRLHFPFITSLLLIL